MTWDAYNRHKEVLHEVLAIADRHREESTATELLAEVTSANRALVSESELLLDAQLIWYHALSSQMDRTVFLRAGTLEAEAISAWHEVAAENPIIRGLLDADVDMPELQKAFANEHEFLARAAGVPANHPNFRGEGKRIKQAAHDTMLYAPAIPDTPAGIFTRIHKALAA